ncbi:MAG: glucosaminidase domain-containing protein [Bacteroidales bacterium]|nr:glucosaminidase domain-containing protein [Bacteroidales bacterium]HOI31254.1 glucosaminidase domain-containing protein [Bacteroidales bacterium]
MKYFSFFYGFGLFLLMIFAGHSLLAQQKISTEEYIKTYKTIAIEKMREYKIPASITLAQGILESGSGNSNLARKANNHFGIKCHTGWTGKKYYMDDDEKNECFRSYRKAEESYHDHSLFLTQRSRYADLFKLRITDYKGWAKGLSKAGYATNPRYPELLIRIIERYDLAAYDKEALTGKASKKQKAEEPKIKVTDIPPKTAEFAVVNQSEQGRFIHENNGVRLIFAKEGDQIVALANELHMYSWQFYKYNDLPKGAVLKAGQIVYVQKKKRKSKTHHYHELQSGETLWDVSQLYGIRLHRIYIMNHWEETYHPATGTAVKLR